MTIREAIANRIQRLDSEDTEFLFVVALVTIAGTLGGALAFIYNLVRVLEGCV